MQIHAANLFDKTATLYFTPEQTHCPVDNKPLHVFKTTTRTIYALGIGGFKAHHTIRYCKQHPERGVFKSRELAELVPANSNVSYSVIAEVGKLRYLQHRQVNEIVDILYIKHAIRLSGSEIELLIEKFIFYLSAVHQESVYLLRAQMKAQGGYILHLDATCEGDSPKLLSSIDSVSGFVLYSLKVNSENTDDISHFLQHISNDFGAPHVVVSDMSKAIQAAVLDVFGDIPHYICHFHFMAAIGNLLVEKEHNALYKALSKAGISGKLKAIRREMPKSFHDLSCDDIEKHLTTPETLGNNREASEMLVYYLVLWILDHPSEGNGYGFPFDQRYLYFYDRLKAAYTLLDDVKTYYRPTTNNDARVWQLYHLIKTVIDDSTLKKTVAQYKAKLAVFTELRTALGVAPKSTTKGLRQNSQYGSSRELKKIKTAVELFMTNFDVQINTTTDNSLKTSFVKVKDRIELYWDRLVADPFVVNVNGVDKTFFVHRTNNIMEQQFRSFAYGYRRIHGNHSIRRNLERIPGALPLVANLKNPDYVALVFDDMSQIAQRFSEIDVLKIRTMIDNHYKMKRKNAMQKLNKLLRKPELKNQLSAAFACVAK